jgi:hypothetical protein
LLIAAGRVTIAIVVPTFTYGIQRVKSQRTKHPNNEKKFFKPKETAFESSCPKFKFFSIVLKF